MNTPYVIVLSTDNNYVQHTGVTLCSVLENTMYPNEIGIYIIDFDIHQDNKDKLAALVEKYGARLHFVRIEQEILKDIHIVNRAHISKAAYGKILISEILSSSIQKAVYLDTDMIVLDDIVRLYDTDLSEYHLAAVLNPFFTRYGQLGLSSPSQYFNSGMMVLNLERLRAFHASQKVLDFVVRHKDKILGGDQDPLNAILHQHWLKLSPRWNLQYSMFRRKAEAEKVFDERELKEAMENPAIIHFTSASKPWYYMNVHPLKDFYYQYLRKTPWEDFQPGDRTIPNMVKKRVKNLLAYIHN